MAAAVAALGLLYVGALPKAKADAVLDLADQLVEAQKRFVERTGRA